MRRYVDDIDAFKDQRQRIEDVIDEAFTDILAGKFESAAVHRALTMGHHPRYTKLKETYDVAVLAARHSGLAK